MATTVAHTASTVGTPMTREEKKVIFASSLGTVFEWYDFYLYATLAPFFAALFFPPGNDTGALLSAFATYAATAIEKARADADAAARAAHGTLGTLLEINIGAYSPPPPRPMMMMARKDAAQDSTPINPGEETLAVEVSTRWRFLPAQ